MVISITKAIVLLAVAGLGLVAAKSAPLVQAALPWPDESQSIETLERSITAIFLADGRGVRSGTVVAMPFRKPYATVHPFTAEATTRETRFGKLTDGQRLTVMDQGAAIDWRGMDEVDGKALLLSGEDLVLVDADVVSMKETTRRSVAWDLIKPPRDPRGEPSTAQVQDLRRRFKKAYQATTGVRVSGMARLPEEWARTKGVRSYLLASRIPGFPLLLMECQKDEPSSCVLARACNLEGAASLKPSAVTGIAVSAERKLVLIGDSAHQRLDAFRFNSCYDIPKKAEVDLPARVKGLVNLYVDGGERLWIASKAPDDYLNASVYFWPKTAW